MKLHDPAFEKRLKRTVWRRIKASPELRKQARQRGGATRLHLPPNAFFHVFGCGLLATLVYNQQLQGLTVGSQLAVISLVCLGLGFFHVTRIYQTLYGSSDLAAFAHLPIADPVIFRWQWQKLWLHSAWPAAYSLLAYLAFAGSHQTGWPGSGAALLAASVQWLVCLSLATGLAAWRPGWPHHLLGLMIVGPFFLFYFIHDFIPPAWLARADASAYVINYLLPTGWVSLLFSQIATGLKPALWLLLPLLAGVLHFGRSGRDLLLSTYRFEESPVAAPELLDDDLETSDEAAYPRSATDAPPPLPSAWQRVGITDHLDSLRSREFLKSEPLVATGWIERLFRRWLTPRESLLMEAFMGRLPGWTKMWKISAALTVVLLVVSASLARSKAEDAQIICLVGGAFLLFLLTPLGLDFHRFISGHRIGTTEVPFIAGFPIGYRDIRGLQYKAAAVRALAALPLLTAGGPLVMAFVFKEPETRSLLWSALIGGKLAVAMLLIQPVVSSSHFSRILKPRHGHLLGKFFTFVVLAVLGIVLLVSLLAGAFVPHLLGSVIGLAIAGVASWLIEAIYIRNYNRGKVDLQMYQPASR